MNNKKDKMRQLCDIGDKGEGINTYVREIFIDFNGKSDCIENDTVTIDGDLTKRGKIDCQKVVEEDSDDYRYFELVKLGMIKKYKDKGYKGTLYFYFYLELDDYLETTYFSLQFEECGILSAIDYN